MDFNADFSGIEGARRVLSIDGRGASSRPFHIIVLEVETVLLDPKTLTEVQRIHRLGSKVSGEDLPCEPSQPRTVTVLDPDILSTFDIEKWAIEYAYKFTKTHNIHATAFILGIEYVERGLPHVSSEPS